MRPLPAIIIIGIVSGCTARDSGPIVIVDMPAAQALRDGGTTESKKFGNDVMGRPLWLSSDGRYAALFRVSDDTDGNGELNIQFGMHGESTGDALALDLFDVEAGTHQRFDDLLSASPDGRFAVLTRGADTFLFDTRNARA